MSKVTADYGHLWLMSGKGRDMQEVKRLDKFSHKMSRRIMRRRPKLVKDGKLVAFLKAK